MDSLLWRLAVLIFLLHLLAWECGHSGLWALDDLRFPRFSQRSFRFHLPCWGMGFRDMRRNCWGGRIPQDKRPRTDLSCQAVPYILWCRQSELKLYSTSQWGLIFYRRQPVFWNNLHTNRFTFEACSLDFFLKQVRAASLLENMLWNQTTDYQRLKFWRYM